MADEKHKNADFIGHVVGDAKNPQETRMLTGWFGESGEDGYRRLYTDAELSSYIDIPDDAILYTEPLKDVQPLGGVIVWIKRDAALKQGGSAASRAARFLQGQVQQDFASAGAPGSIEKAGLRCVTEVPCGEPTGFTGQCTKQPYVGGAWPCITEIPHCFEPTGFTGKCTHAPWPNPTRYYGCTQLHCPTNDLTHIPHICNIVASGNPGCVVVNQPQEGDPAPKVGATADAEENALPATHIPGCGYTKSWGVCETHLLGCGFTKDWGHQCPTLVPDCPTAAPGCGLSRNPVCTDLPGCGFTKPAGVCHPPTPPVLDAAAPWPPTGINSCTLSCGHDAAAVGAPGGGGAGQPSILCATNIGCTITLFCPTRNVQICYRTPVCPTRFQPQCFPVASPFCPVTPGCPFGPGGGGTPVQQHFAAFGAAAPAAAAFTDAPCSAVDTCPSRPCFTQPPTALCTQIPQANCPTLSPDLCPCTTPPENCPTGCGVNCQTPQPNCTQCNCPTINGPNCPPPSIGIACTALPPCPRPTIDPLQCPPTKLGAPCPTPQLDCTFTVTQAGTGCPDTPLPNCAVITIPNVGAQAFVGRPLPLSQVGCPPSDLVACSQFGGCNTQPPGDCTFFGCPSLQQVAAAGPGGGCTQSGPLCPTHARPQCTFFGPGCPPTPATVCTQFAPCPTHHLPCRTPGFECTMFCTQVAPGCPHTIQNAACPITVGGPQCPVHTGFNCPSAIGCQSIACQSIACQPGGGGQQQFAQQAVGGPQTLATVCTQAGVGCPHTLGCPTPGIDCTVFCTHVGPHCPTAATVCTQTGPQCHTHLHPICPTGGVDCTVVICTRVGPLCPPNTHPPHCPPPTPLCLTVAGPHCPPHTIQSPACPVLTLGGPQCPPASGFNCPSQFGCQSIACGQSIACLSAACQPGGGGQQEFAQQAVGGPQTLATVCTQVGVGCPHTLGCPTPGIDCTVFCTHVGPHCPTPATVCTQSGPQCHTRIHHQCPSPGIDCTVIICTHVGPLCPPNTHPPHCPPPTPACPTAVGPACPPHTFQAHLCPITANSPQCPRATGVNCPSVLGCQSLACAQTAACVSAACQPGGGGQQAFGAAFDQSTEFCPTSGGCGGVVHPQAAIGGHTPWFPTPATRCFICPPFGTEAAAPAAAVATGPGYGCTYFGPNCPATHAPGCGSTHHFCTPVCG